MQLPYVYYLVFVYYVSDVIAYSKYDLVPNGRLSIPRNTVDRIKNEVLPFYQTTLDKKAVEYKILNKMADLTERQKWALRNENKNDLRNFVYHLISKGTRKLTAHINYFKLELGCDMGISKIIENATKNYTTILENYSDHILRNADAVYDIDKEFIALDLLESANQLLYYKCKAILNNMRKSSVNIKNKAFRMKVSSMSKGLRKLRLEDKKEEMEYICQYLEICRTWPAYSDYMLDLIKEILRLSDVKLNYFISNLKVIIKEQANYVKAVLTDELYSILSNNLGDLFDDEFKLRNSLARLGDVLSRRHRLTRSKDNGIIRRSKATCILIDIINKAFDSSDSDILSIYFDNAIKLLRDWGNKKVFDDIPRVTGSFVRYSFENFKYYWRKETREEIKVLIGIILGRKAKYENDYGYLFKRGSVFVNSVSELDNDISM